MTLPHNFQFKMFNILVKTWVSFVMGNGWLKCIRIFPYLLAYALGALRPFGVIPNSNTHPTLLCVTYTGKTLAIYVYFYMYFQMWGHIYVIWFDSHDAGLGGATLRVLRGGVFWSLTTFSLAVTPTYHGTPRAAHPEVPRRTARIRCLAFLLYISIVYLTMCCSCVRPGYQAYVECHKPRLFQVRYYLALKARRLRSPFKGVCPSRAYSGLQACLACQTSLSYQSMYYWVLMTINVCSPLGVVSISVCRPIREISIIYAVVLHICMLICVRFSIVQYPAFCMDMCRRNVAIRYDTPSVTTDTAMWTYYNFCTCAFGIYCHILRRDLMAELLPVNRCIPCCEAMFVFILTKFSYILQCARVRRRRSCTQDGSPPSGATLTLLYPVTTQRCGDSFHAPALGLRSPFVPIPTCYLHLFGSPAVPSSDLRCASGSVPADGPRALVKDFLCYTNGLAHLVRINAYAFAFVSALMAQLLQHQVNLRRLPCILYATSCKATILRCKAISCVCDYCARVPLIPTTTYATCKAMGSRCEAKRSLVGGYYRRGSRDMLDAMVAHVWACSHDLIIMRASLRLSTFPETQHASKAP